MKFAIVEGDRREAETGLSGKCPACGNVMIAKCGEQRIRHWSHKGKRTCDHWWEPETEWHRDWKNHFPKDCQEKIHTSKEGEKHIADVKTEHGIVLEFQHSFLRRDERESRETFYKNMVWVVNGRRRVLDMRRFFTPLRTAGVICRTPLIVSVPWREGALLREWGDSRAPVYFDFGDSEPADTLGFDKSFLWRLNPRCTNGGTYLSPIAKTYFLEVYRTGLPFDEEYTNTIERYMAGGR